MARSLRLLGCEVDEAGSVDRAIARLREEAPFDVVLLDVRLGTESGVEVARAAWQMSPAPAIVATSGEASRAEMFELGRLGVRAFVDKAELSARLGDLLALAAQPSPVEPHAITQVGHSTMAETVASVRRAMLEQALGLEDGSCARASVRLGVSRQAVQQLRERERQRSTDDED
ncbi:MAG: response regulator [Myxococcales bacterium]|nr:response regulator [Myxococcales bacterium]